MIRSIRLAVPGLVVAFAASGVAQMPPNPQPTKGFTALAQLAGSWDGLNAQGKVVHVTYQVVSSGTALLERLDSGEGAEMVTVYTADGDRLAVTHYCSAGNQPQMATNPVNAEVKQFSFNFVRATNLTTPTAGHMHHLTVTIKDHDHFSEEWTWMDGAQSHAETFSFTRKV